MFKTQTTVMDLQRQAERPLAFSDKVQSVTSFKNAIEIKYKIDINTNLKVSLHFYQGRA